MAAVDNLVQPPRRRRRWWRWLLVLVLLVGGAVAGAGWWALSTNQTGNLVSHLFAKRLPGVLEVDRSDFTGVEGLVLTGVRLRESSAAPPAVTVERVVVTGQLWRGEIDRIRIEGLHLHATPAAVHFLHRLIQAENAHPGSDNPSLLNLDFTGGRVSVLGRQVIDQAEVAVSTRGPFVTVHAHGRLDDLPAVVQVATDGSGDQRTYRIGLIEGRLPIHRLCERLAELELLPPLPDDARPWVPEHADAAGTVVIADKDWRHFGGAAVARWEGGQGQADLQVDRRFVRLTRAHIQDRGLGTLDGQIMIDTDESRVAVSATTWSPGPRLPIPGVVPTAGILNAMPRAQLDAQVRPGAQRVALTLQGTGQAVLTWSSGSPLTISGGGIALSLLQPFLPGEVTLASGSATTLQAEVGGDGLRSFSAVIDQARVLWRGWALGSLAGRVGLRVVGDGIDLDVALPALGKASWRAATAGGRLSIEVTDGEALMVRLKGPQVLPEFTGAASLDARIAPGDPALLVDVERLHLQRVGITDLLRTLDTELSGAVRVHAQRVDAHLTGRLTSGELRIPGGWRDLAKRQPRFNAQLSFGGGLILAEKILLRATDAAGEAQVDGYSAGLRGRFSLSDLTGTVIGVVDHADLGWLNTLIPIPDGVAAGEGAVTFTAQVVRDRIDSVEGHFLPLDARLKLGNVLNASGIKGVVAFRIARPGAK
jgi:hypothetical protein